ncbi:hypothetical protein K7432_002626 [Basidiobolus ranarum]|uniref:Uncharacterized protein n=1 Tax=Basidiobolus ranarum TaxID=34480 RepID=A0ABR2X1B1_9FUNG
MKASLTIALTLLSVAHVNSAPIEEATNQLQARSLLGGEAPNNNIGNILNFSGSQGKGKNILGSGIINMDNESETISEKGSERTTSNEKVDKMNILGSIQQLLNQPKGDAGKAILKRALDKDLLSTEEINQLLSLSKPNTNSDVPSNRILSSKEKDGLISRLLSSPLAGGTKGANPLAGLFNLGSAEPGDKKRPATDKALNGLNLLKRGSPLDILSGLTGGKGTPGKSILSAPTINSDIEESKDQEQKISKTLDDREKETAILPNLSKSGGSKEAGLLRVLSLGKENNNEPAMSRVLTTTPQEQKKNNLGLGEILNLGKRDE